MGWESSPVVKDLKPPFSALKAEHLSSVTSPFLTNMLLVLISVITPYSPNFCCTTYLLLTLSCCYILILLHCM